MIEPAGVADGRGLRRKPMDRRQSREISRRIAPDDALAGSQILPEITMGKEVLLTVNAKTASKTPHGGRRILSFFRFWESGRQLWEESAAVRTWNILYNRSHK
jgi:hypothetical protein